jgi:hypothetical protein
MREFKFLTKNDGPKYEGNDIVYVGPLLYEPYSFNTVRMIHYINDDGYTTAVTVDSDHPIWEQLETLH